PIGDMPPVMLALDAEVVLEKKGASRTVPLADFFLAYRKTAIAPDEIVRWITFPRHPKNATRKMESYKVSKRRELDISITAAAFVVDTDGKGIVTHARLAFG